ncbi:uncharacterized protein P884DRAFT_326176 [Thermothelomyces heterothallicus CBS 202.75]|uniref:uncharacterized protein n=1 Tax=Thermothelomyces heterothallicus CBS 202.75 TaxID=1149848 RepID=UPI0037432D30
MSPPPSSTRSTHVDASGATTPSIATSTSALAAAASRNANPAVSAALQGATLAFNKQKAAAAVGGNGNSNSNSNSNGSSAGSLGLGPAPSRQPNQNHVRAITITAGQGTGPNNRSGTGVSAASAQGPEQRGGSGALLAATRAARDHAAAAAASTTAVTRPRPVDERSPGYAGGGVARHATGGTTVNTSLSGDGESKEAAGSAHWSGREPDGGGHAHGGLVAQRLLELHAAGGGTGSHRSTLLPPPGGPDGLTGKQASSPSSTSPSFIAATLAASSASSLSSSVMPEKDLPDTSSIPPTTSLVSLFESKRGKDDVDPVKKKPPSVRTESGDVRSQAGGKEAHQAPGKAKPKPVPKPKPGFSPDHGRKTGLDGNARGSANDTSQRGNTTALDGSDDNKGRSDLRPPRSPPASQSTGHKPITKPSASASQRPVTPPSSAPDRAISNHTNPQTMKLLRTPRMGPPAPPERASGTTMKGPAVPGTLGTSRNDRADAVPHDYQDPTPKPRQPPQSSTPSNDTFVSASSVQLWTMPPVNAADETADETAVQRPPVPRLSPSPRSTTTPEFQPPLFSDTSTTNLTLGSLTNAIVASNIASARLTPTSSSQPPPVPAPRRSGRSPLRPHHTADSIRSQLGRGGSGSRSPSRRNAPQQQQQQQPHKTGVLLQTLRSPHTSLSDDEDARRQQLHHHHRRRNKVLGGGNRKHAHHEGSRRRWRDEITPRERRRYEAVWASNRGLLLRPGWAVQYTAADGDEPEGGGKREAEADSQDDDNNNNNNNNILDQSRAPPGRPEAELVVNVVARDIWSRSRLPADELAEVWDLVDRDRRGALGRDEFVVGMWLIDQRLRGRKIPARVSRSVWDSVAGGGALGVVVPLPPKTPAGSKKTGQGWKGWYDRLYVINPSALISAALRTTTTTTTIATA